MVRVPNVWPLGNIYNIWMLDPKTAPKTTSQGAWYFELFVRYLRLSTYVLLTAFQYKYLFPKDLAICKDFTLDWVGMVYARNLCIGWLLYGGWHWILYVSPLKANLEGKKFNPVDQYRKGTANLSREMFYTTQGLVIGASFEVLMMHLWGTGRVPYATDFWATPVSSVLWVLFVGYWREFHFFWIHRWYLSPHTFAFATHPPYNSEKSPWRSRSHPSFSPVPYCTQDAFRAHLQACALAAPPQLQPGPLVWAQHAPGRAPLLLRLHGHSDLPPAAGV
jgi:hypothetical protein